MQKSSTKSKSDLLRLSVTLFVIAAVMATLVSFVNNITEAKIEEINKKKITDALIEVIPDADSFEELDYSQDSVMSSDGKKIGIDGVWQAFSGNEPVGICVKVSPQGYGGKIETIVGIGDDGTVIDTRIVSLSETSGIGTKIKDDGFLNQFIGKSGSVTESEPDGVLLISGATKSSKAYLRGINAALTVAADCAEVSVGE